MEAALLELLAAATWAGIVSADALEWINKGKGRVGKGKKMILNASGSPLLIPLCRLREGIPARELAHCILKRPDLVTLKTHHALRIS